MKKRKATIKDVAQHARVSVASVSYALNGVDKISEQTKARILKAVEELDYQTNMTAKCLSEGTSRLIGVTLPITERGDIPGMLFESNPFFSEFLSGVELLTRNKGYDILISGLDERERYKNWIHSRALDGLIMLGACPKDLHEEIRYSDIPVALADVYDHHAEHFHRVLVDDEAGGYLATKHLIDLGHTGIAFATGKISNSAVVAKRYAGYIRAHEEAGLPLNPSLVLEGRMSLEGGANMGEYFLKERIPATSIFAGSDVVALGLIKALSRAEVHVPKDISIVGFDNIKFSTYASPGITTVDQDIILKGKTAAKLILDDLQRGQRTNSLITLPVRLIVRESTVRRGETV